MGREVGVGCSGARTGPLYVIHVHAFADQRLPLVLPSSTRLDYFAKHVNDGGVAPSGCPFGLCITQLSRWLSKPRIWVNLTVALSLGRL